MTTFNDKEKSAENKYARDKETEFKIHARAHKLLALWAAAKMGLAGKAAEDYANSIITADLGKTSNHSVLERIKDDLLARDVHISDHEVKAEMHRLEGMARQQVEG